MQSLTFLARRRFREDLFTITYDKLVSATQTKRMAYSFPLKHIVAVSLLVFALETSSVVSLRWGECEGQRLAINSASPMSPSKCVSIGGTCCDIGSYMIDDPKTMKETDKCLTCYKSTVKMKCTGALIRSKPWNWGHANNWVTAKTCIAQKGQCCSGGSKTFNPNSSPNEIFCNNCYSGAATSSRCSGKLLDSAYFTPSVCVALGGQCCDGDFAGTSTGSAFPTWAVFNPSILKSCNLCYNGPAVLAIQHNTMRSRNINMRHIVAIALVVFIMETQNVTGTLRWGQCTGLRLDNSVSSFTASDCVSMGGKCCDLGQLTIETDVTTGDPSQRCLTCYNPDVKVKCTGKLLISKTITTFTAGKCIAAKGNCCNGFFQNKFQRYNVRDAPSDAYCSECFSGTMTGNGSGCSGKLLATTKDLEPQYCASIGGRCCDEAFVSADQGFAYCPWRKFNSEVWKKCNLCYSGPPRIAA
uniref:Uncharacterized protein n=1 Tax=Daphnia galeata TaxID=27404 RepID=A0A8J2VZF5_9CRUS|nr:unnamed protein product [Daphnia galeata]